MNKNKSFRVYDEILEGYWTDAFAEPDYYNEIRARLEQDKLQGDEVVELENSAVFQPGQFEKGLLEYEEHFGHINLVYIETGD